jgi:hypothetical protein
VATPLAPPEGVRTCLFAFLTARHSFWNAGSSAKGARPEMSPNSPFHASLLKGEHKGRLSRSAINSGVNCGSQSTLICSRPAPPADALGDELARARVAKRQPAPLRHAVGLHGGTPPAVHV